MKTTFYLDKLKKVHDCNDETPIRAAPDFEFEFDGCPSVDTSELRNAMIEYRDSLNTQNANAVYQKRANVERQLRIIYKRIYDAMK